jgi:signal transduction histidine kinase
VDALLVALVAGQLVELFTTRPGVAEVAVVVLMVLAPAALLLRRRVPVPAVVVSFLGYAALIQLVPASLSTTFLALLFAVGVSGSLPRPAAAFGLVGALAVGVEGAWLDRYGGGAGDFAMSAAIMVGVWVCGALISATARAAARNADRLQEAEHARTEAARVAVQEERARMTRELHDAVAHALTVLVVQAVAAQQDLEHGEPATRLAARLRATEEVAREALLELRTLLGILGTDDQGPTSTGLAGVQALVARLSSPEFPVELQADQHEHDWGHGADLAVYRIVQEGLTNALKHGAGQGARVVLAQEDGALRIEVSNTVPDHPPAQARSGRGLRGLQERLAQLGGTIETSTQAGLFRLVCTLPVPANIAVGS